MTALADKQTYQKARQSKFHHVIFLKYRQNTSINFVNLKFSYYWVDVAEFMNVGR